MTTAPAAPESWRALGLLHQVQRTRSAQLGHRGDLDRAADGRFSRASVLTRLVRLRREARRQA